MQHSDVYTFLFDLQESGITNMFGAVPYIMDEFPTLTRVEARACLQYWMDHYRELKKLLIQKDGLPTNMS